MRFSIQSKILILSLSCTLVGTLTLGTLSIMFISRITQRTAMQEIENQINAEATNLNAAFVEQEKYTQALVSGIYSQIRLDSNSFFNKQNFAVHIENIKDRITSSIDNVPGAKAIYVRFNPSITAPDAGLFLVKSNESGAPFASIVPTNITQYSPSDIEHVGWYYLPLQTGKPMWLSPYYNKNIDVYMISYVVPMFHKNQELGVTGIDIDFELMTKLIAKIRILKTGYAYLEDSEGLVTYHPTFPVGLSFKPGNDQVSISTKLFNGMTLVAIIPTSELNAERNKLILQYALFILILLVLTTAITIFFAKSITRPLKKLTEEAKKMITGNMNVEFNISKKDEIGELARTFAAAKIHINQYMKQMQGLAFRDSLTGIGNKMAYDNYLSELELRIDNDEVQSYGIVVLDTNNLKEINDTYGHENGNAYLINSCKLICQIFAHSPVFRIGGDEFIVILLGDDLKNHQNLLKILRESQIQTKNAAFPWKQISIACGIAIAQNAKDTTIAETFNKADESMYKNKRALKIQKV
ncbi:MAG: diguanylate cyclase [Fibrobacter sp.]|nr:diguanylate cyclase [Fibrobacter sp.]